MEHEKRGTNTKTFWEQAVVYQIYPRTFNEDTEREQTGQGSLRGILERLDYLQSLGVDAVWLSPFYTSPRRDGGYDVSDMENIDTIYGGLDDFSALVDGLHERNMKLMVDLVPNHTSDEHPWFQASRERRDDKADWYIWADGIIDEFGDKQPPNNWGSVFSLPQLKRRESGELIVPDGEITPPLPGWTWNETRGQYYMHSFADFQPDLNWLNPEVRSAIKSVMRVWLDRGVDGFRADAVPYIGKNMHYDEQGIFHGPNEEYNTAYVDGIDNPYDQLIRHNSSGYSKTLHPYLHEMVAVLDEPAYQNRDTRIIFEAYMQEHKLKYIDELAPGRASSFNFTPIKANWHMPTPVRKQILDKYYARIDEARNIPNSVMGNHDKPRVASRYNDQIAKSLALYSLMQPGMMFIYNGEELGRHDFDRIPPEMIRDPNGMRDPERTPMPWNSLEKNTGFSNADAKDLYLPMNPDDTAVDIQSTDNESFLSYYRRLTAWKHRMIDDYVALDIETVDGKNNGVIAYGRGDAYTVITNFTNEPQTLEAISPTRKMGKVVLSSIMLIDNATVQTIDTITLQPNEAILIEHE